MTPTPEPTAAHTANGIRALASALRDHRVLRGSLPWVLLLLLSANLLVHRWQRSLQDSRSRNLLINTMRPTAGGIRWDWSVGEDLDRYWPALAELSSSRTVILAGMSQMYAINDPGPRDETVSELLDDALSPRGIRVFGLAAPNLCNEEALLLLLATLSELPRPPEAFVYGVCFDKFRNLNLRTGYQRFVASHASMRDLWQATADSSRVMYPKASAKMAHTLETALASDHDRDDGVEAGLRRLASRLLPVVAAQNDLNAAAQLRLFLWRNALFHIKPTSKRPVIEERYELNVEFLELLVDVARSRGVRVILYVIPLNPQSENPYLPDQYAAFKGWLQGYCRTRAIPFANLENTVPAPAWGTFMGGPDFKHFTGEGHRLTAAALLDQFGTMIAPRAAAGKATDSGPDGVR
jgi:hypothetical protein